MSLVRRPAVAGSFYPSDPGELRKAVDGCYTDRLGPGRLPSKPGATKGLEACVCPHAGYVYSGPVAAHSYLEVSKLGSPDLVVVLGPNHYGIGGGVATYGKGEWETPLGRVRVDDAATERLVELAEIVDVDPQAHLREHSIEVQLPFLQRIYGTGFPFLPVSLAFQDEGTARDLAKAVAELLRDAAEARRSAVLIASSDLTHYEPAPQAVEKDTALLERVESLDLKGFYTTLQRRRITACGYGAIATVMETCRILGMKRAVVNAYHTSGDVTGDSGSVVGYPSVSFRP